MVSDNVQKLREISPHLMDPDVAAKIFESLPDALVVVNDKGLIMFVNLQAEILFRYTRREMYDQPIEMLIPEAIRERHVGNRTKFFTAPTSRPMALRQELKGRTKDGTEFGVEVNLSPVITSDGLLVSASIRMPRDGT